MRLRRVGRWSDLMSRPERVREGGPPDASLGVRTSRSAVGGYIPNKRDAIVLLPEPEAPTMAVQFPAGIVTFRRSRAGASGRVG